MLKSLKLAHKLPLLIVGTAVTLTAILIAVSTSYFRNGVIHDAEVFMQSMVRDRELALQSYLEGLDAATLTIASVPSTAKAMKDLSATWVTRDGNAQSEVQNLSMFASAASPYEMHFERSHSAFQKVMERMGFYDVFLISPAGDVVFSVTKESDYATNMVTGPYRNSGLAKVFQMAMAGEPEQVYFSDIEAYEPSADAPAAFAATRVLDESGRFAGVFALQVAIDEIARITTNFGGDLETLDVYLIGEDFPGPHPVPPGRRPRCARGTAASSLHRNCLFRQHASRWTGRRHRGTCGSVPPLRCQRRWPDRCSGHRACPAP